MLISIHRVSSSILIFRSCYFYKFFRVYNLIVNSRIICVDKWLLLIMLLTEISRTSLSGCLVKHLCLICSFIFTSFRCCPIINERNFLILKLDNNRLVNYDTVMFYLAGVLRCLLTCFVKIKSLLLIRGLLRVKILWLLCILTLCKVFSLSCFVFIFLRSAKYSILFNVLIF